MKFNKTYFGGQLLLYSVGILLFAAAVFQVVYKIDSEPVKIWDESFTAQNAVEMMQNQNYLVVYHQDRPDHFNTRPPMAIWTKVISYSIFGINSLSTRIPTIISAILIMLMMLLFCVRFLKDYGSGFVILILIACTAGFNTHHVARTGDPDTLLLLFVSVYIIVYFVLLETFPKSRVKYYVLLGLATVLAVYTKSILGLAPMGGLLIYTLLQKNGYKLLRDYRFHITWIASVILILAYYLIRERYDPGYIQAVIAQEFSIIEKPLRVKHPEFDFYFKYLYKDGFYPFVYFLPISLIPLLFSSNNRIRRLLLYCLVGGLTFLLGISNATLKNEWYVAPLFPFLWLFTAVGLSETVKMITSFLPGRTLRRVVSAAALAWFIYYSFSTYEYILKSNTDNPNQYVYEPERAGMYLDEIKTAMPELKKISVVTFEHPRQLNFFAKKYEYLDATEVEVFAAILPDLEGKTVIICDDSVKEIVRTKYDYKILDQEKYCTLFSIGGADSSDIKKLQ